MPDLYAWCGDLNRKIPVIHQNFGHHNLVTPKYGKRYFFGLLNMVKMEADFDGDFLNASIFLQK